MCSAPAWKIKRFGQNCRDYVVADNLEVLITGTAHDIAGTITRNRNLVGVARQFIWIELFTQRVYARLGADLLVRLEADDRRIFESLRRSASGNGST